MKRSIGSKYSLVIGNQEHGVIRLDAKCVGGFWGDFPVDLFL